MRITKVKLIGGQEIEFGDINVFVGPNGVGKTTLMNEIREFFCQGSASTNHWVTGFENGNIEPNDASILLGHIKEHTETNDAGKEIKKYTISHNKDNFGKYDSQKSSDEYAENIYKKLVALSKKGKGHNKKDIQLPNRHLINRLFIGYENTRERLNLAGEETATDTKDPLNNIVNVILHNKGFREYINESFLRCFNRPLFFSAHRTAMIEILVGKANTKSIEKLSGKDFEEVEKIKKNKGIFNIDKVGDGMLATAKLFFSLFDPNSKIIFIDEPEAFIHPKQKINIARELKNLVQKNKKQLFLSTHDTTFLSGLIDNKEDKIKINIFYIKDHQKIIPLDKFLVGNEKIRPTTKHQKYLQSSFYDGTIFSEGPNDRCFYEHAIGELFKKNLAQKDIVFTDLSGASSALQVAQFVKESEINAVFIFDKDVIVTNKDKQQSLPKIYKELGGKKDLERMLLNLPSDMKKIIKELEIYGIFIVPNGELASWIGGITKNDDGFPYNLIEKMIAKPTKEFKKFAEKILQGLSLK